MTTPPHPTSTPSLTVGTAQFSANRPALIVPLAAPTRKKVVKTAGKFADDADIHDVDVIEWRIDALEDPQDVSALKSTLKDLKKIFGKRPLLVTLRTATEGGNADLSPDDYATVLLELLSASKVSVDMIDVEYAQPRAAEIIDAAHEANTVVIGSSHNFSETPSRSEIIETLHSIQAQGADISKVAVMPNSTADLLTLFEATTAASSMLARPIITVSMGALGFASRVSGGLFGSSATFASLGDASAPGQAPVSVVSSALKVVHPNS